MAIRRRSTGTVTVGTTGAVSGSAIKAVGLGAKYAVVRFIEFKGISGSDSNTTLAVVDRDGRIVYKADVIDSTTDDSTVKQTAQFLADGVTANTKGKIYAVTYPEAATMENDATDGTAGGGQSVGVLARSPVTVTIAAGTDTDTHEVNLYVEV